MTIKEATSAMLWQISIHYNIEGLHNEAKDRSIAEYLGISKSAYSRLKTQVTTPSIYTWWKIIQLHRKICGNARTEEMLNKICA